MAIVGSAALGADPVSARNPHRQVAPEARSRFGAAPMSAIITGPDNRTFPQMLLASSPFKEIRLD
ncbi:MAG: hypothetical protein ACRCVA_15315, partial [Phreatobacter sp.]